MQAWAASAGLWAPGFANVKAWAAGVADPLVIEPAAALLPERLARRASMLTRIAAEVLEQVCPGARLSDVATVYATAYGETQTLGAILDSMATDGSCSPARFHQSVQNTAAGLLSIANGNRGFSTTISAGADTVAMALLECFGVLQQESEVIAVFAEEPPPAPFAQSGFAAAGAALRLSREPTPGAQRVSLRRAEAEPPFQLPGEFANNPITVSLSLAEALHLRRSGTFALSPAPGGWAVEIGVTAGAEGEKKTA
jgi:hypothetical protein